MSEYRRNRERVMRDYLQGGPRTPLSEAAVKATLAYQAAELNDLVFEAFGRPILRSFKQFRRAVRR